MPVFLSDRVEAALGGFAAHPHGNDIVVCWRESIASRDARLWGAVVHADGSLSRAPFVLYEETDSTSSLSGWAGSCGVVDDQIVSVILRYAVSLVCTQRAFVSDIPPADATTSWVPNTRPLGDAVNYVSLVSSGVPEMTQFQLVPNGNGLMMVYPRDSSRANTQPQFFETTIDPRLAVDTHVLQTPITSLSEYFQSSTGFRATSGTWIVAVYLDGGSLIGWAPGDGSLGHYNNDLIPRESPAAVLGHRGDDIAMAYRVSTNGDAATWRVVWIHHDASGEQSTMGPELTFASALAQPAGAVNSAGDLVIGGATGSDRVRVWQVAWNSSQPATEIGSIPKTSALVPERLVLSVAGERVFVEWTERAPSTATGTSYSALFVGVANR